jgi:hypothetical protein
MLAKKIWDTVCYLVMPVVAGAIIGLGTWLASVHADVATLKVRVESTVEKQIAASSETNRRLAESADRVAENLASTNKRLDDIASNVRILLERLGK